MLDTQNTPDTRDIPVKKVGIRNILHPLTLLDQRKGRQNTTANVSMAVDLPRHFRGTHMSRFVELLNERKGDITLRNMGDVLSTMIKRLHSEDAHIEERFTYFMEKTAPVSGSKSLMSYECAFISSMSRRKSQPDSVLEVNVPVTTLCPCSKEISEKGAHNQRSNVRIQVKYNNFVWIEELVRTAEKSASCGVYALLKREDEKFVTEKAYDNPSFAEDLVRNIAGRLKTDSRIQSYRVETENFESIHNHSAYAMVEHGWTDRV